MNLRRGLTLIELILAMGLAGLVFILVSSMLVLLTTSNIRSRTRDGLDKIKKDLFIEFQEGIKWVDGNVFLYGEEIITGQQCNVNICSGKIDESGVFVGSKYKYDFEMNGTDFVSGVIKKDGIPITPANIIVTKFEVVKHGAVGESLQSRFAYEITIEFLDKSNKLLKDVINIPVSNRILITQ